MIESEREVRQPKVSDRLKIRALKAAALGGLAVAGISGAYIANHDVQTPEEIVYSTPETEIDSSELVVGFAGMSAVAITALAIYELLYQSRKPE